MFKNLANAVRFLSVHQVESAKSGHLGMPLGMADCLTVLFKDFLVFDAENPKWPNRDRFIMSGGHGSAALYSLLYLTGYKNMTLNDLKNFRKLGSRATGHPEYDLECGIEITTGPLGQGFANAVGMAIEERLLSARYGSDCINHYTYVCAGDGDLMEGVSQEASSIAGLLSLGKLIVLFDDNGITIDGATDISQKEDILKKYEAYGWHVQSIDGHDEEKIAKSIAAAKDDSRPSLIACKTKIGYGLSFEGTSKAHSGALCNEEISALKEKLNWNCAAFDLPEYIEKTWKIIGKRHKNLSDQWFKKYGYVYGESEFQFSDEFKKIFRNMKKEFFVSRPFAATRSISKGIISKLMAASDLIVSGSADLGGSTGCYSQEMVCVSKDDFLGNYIHYGVREHAMGAILNGIAAGRKIRCFGGTFLAFSDYMRPAIRMSAMMNIPTIFIFSHDSIGVGEDGPTHQPVEQLASLRAIPNLNVFRPADGMETLECWELALKSKGPSVLILTRQEILSVRFCGRANLCESGGYLLHYDSTEHKRKVTLIATGSEVGIALEVRKMLTDANISANVLSIPCWNLFDKQSNEYKNNVLGDSMRVGIEASNGFGWEKYIGNDGLFFGVNTFGKSCSCQEGYKLFGLTAKNIYDAIIRKINWK